MKQKDYELEASLGYIDLFASPYTPPINKSPCNVSIQAEIKWQFDLMLFTGNSSKQSEECLCSFDYTHLPMIIH